MKWSTTTSPRRSARRSLLPGGVPQREIGCRSVDRLKVSLFAAELALDFRKRMGSGWSGRSTNYQHERCCAEMPPTHRQFLRSRSRPRRWTRDGGHQPRGCRASSSVGGADSGGAVVSGAPFRDERDPPIRLIHRPSAHMAAHGSTDSRSGAIPAVASQPQLSAAPAITAAPARSSRSSSAAKVVPCVVR